MKCMGGLGVSQAQCVSAVSPTSGLALRSNGTEMAWSLHLLPGPSAFGFVSLVAGGMEVQQADPVATAVTEAQGPMGTGSAANLTPLCGEALELRSQQRNSPEAGETFEEQS